MIKRIILPALVLTALAGIVSCRPKAREIEPDTRFLRESAWDYARRYRAMLTDGSTEMQRMDFLLDVNARQTQIDTEVGPDYAIIFRRAFADSAFTKQ